MFFKWFKDRDWLFRKVRASGPDLQSLKRTYSFMACTTKPQKEWGWGKKIIAPTALLALKAWRDSSQGWTRMDYEIGFCWETNEKLYIKTEYSVDKMSIELLPEAPTTTPTLISVE